MVCEPDGVVVSQFDRAILSDQHPPYACAYADGSTGCRVCLSYSKTWDDVRPERVPVNIVALWRKLRTMLSEVVRWPREQCGYGGPLTCRVGAGNLNEVIGVLSDDIASRSRLVMPKPAQPNRLPYWQVQTLWDTETTEVDLIDELIPSLTRPLQFNLSTEFRPRIRAAATHWGRCAAPSLGATQRPLYHLSADCHGSCLTG